MLKLPSSLTSSTVSRIIYLSSTLRTLWSLKRYRKSDNVLSTYFLASEPLKFPLKHSRARRLQGPFKGLIKYGVHIMRAVSNSGGGGVDGAGDGSSSVECILLLVFTSVFTGATFYSTIFKKFSWQIHNKIVSFHQYFFAFSHTKF